MIPEITKDCIDGVLRAEARAPLSTYRLQMHAGFNFTDAEAVIPYLRQLGIGDGYTSPLFEARPGSMHGYDVTRQDRFNPELGGDEGFERFSDALREAGMGLLLDTVPNHMGVGNDSVWWQDVLENGKASKYAEFFDIDWKPLKEDMQGKLLLPILGNQYGEELENKRIQIALEDGELAVRYFDHKMPLAPLSLPLLFPEAELDEMGAPEAFRDLLREITHLPPHSVDDPALVEQRRQQLAELKPRLRAAMEDPEVKSVVERAIEKTNGVEGDARSFDRLHEILEAQPYRLAFWRVSSEEINYRRFFDINDLVGLRMENPEVFAATHALIRKTLAEKRVTGLRIDHCDGMFNPRQYLIRLQMLYTASQCVGPVPMGPTAPNGVELVIRQALHGFNWGSIHGSLYVVVEKILDPGEMLPPEWSVRGTSGYDFVHFANQVFILKQNEKRFNALYTNLLGRTSDPDEIIYRSKLQVMQNALSSETYVLTNLLSQIASADRRARDFTDNILEAAIRETIASFPVYRTYIDDRGRYTERDRIVILRAIARAKHRSPDIDASAFDFLENTLLLHGKSGQEIDARELYFALKFQQLTGPVMAKGVEDTAFYVYNRFISSNEVGSSMKSFGISVESFHASNRERLENFPDALLATSTHDTKRSEDVRNRLNVLSEMTYPWPSLVRRWQRLNAKLKRKLDDGRVAPDANEEYLIYQTIVGAWPWVMESLEDRQQFVERLQQYMMKALSEAKVNLSWINPNEEYVTAVNAFVSDILIPKNGKKETRFVETLDGLVPVARLFGAVNSLAQVLIKIASPGVPDFYQGSEMWDLSLVDPDNRRPVDYKLRADALAGMQRMAEAEGRLAVCNDVLATLRDGRIKLWTVHRALATRNELAEVFRRGDYVPVSIENGHAQHAIAFLRRSKEHAVLTAVPRFAYTLMQGKPHMPIQDAWGHATLALPGQAGRVYENVFTGELLRVADNGKLALRDLFADFPVAMLRSRD
jgi:(1->4)-alpha-D-glucan 1-alpha-D-glucosylmutase